MLSVLPKLRMSVRELGLTEGCIVSIEGVRFAVGELSQCNYDQDALLTCLVKFTGLKAEMD